MIFSKSPRAQFHLVACLATGIAAAALPYGSSLSSRFAVNGDSRADIDALPLRSVAELSGATANSANPIGRPSPGAQSLPTPPQNP